MSWIGRARFLLAPFLLLSLVACASSGSQPNAPASTPISGLGGARSLDVSGTYRHAEAGLTYPESAVGFIRSKVIQFDGAGRDVAGDYAKSLGTGTLIATVYVYPWSDRSPGASVMAACADSFARVKEATITGMEMKGGRLLEVREDTPVEDIFANGQGGFRMVFDVTYQAANYRSLVYLYCGVKQDWLVKYRFTYPVDAEIGTALEDFQKQVPGR